MSIKHVDAKSSLLDRTSLKAGYKDFLFRLQPNIPMSCLPCVEFVTDFDKSQKLASCFNVNLEKEGINKLINRDTSVENSIANIQEQLELLYKFDNRLHSLFTLAVNMIFCGDSAHAVGGTTSAAIGIIWGNPSVEWRTCDYFEYFIHELTHTLMFLDELRFLHYKNQEIMYEKENFSLSAILQAERPIDRVLHSIVVATEVLLFRFRNLVDHSVHQVHPSTEQLIESTQKSIDRLLSHPNIDNILTQRSFEIIGICHNNICKQSALASIV